MKISRRVEHVVIRCSDHEFEILKLAMRGFSADRLSTTGHRRSWSRRTRDGDFLRIDKDYRGDVYD